MIGLIDCNNFFVSCERLFRPDLQKKPVAVLSSNDGCIVARSQEVKKLGIPMGVPYFQIKNMCKKEKITIFSSNFQLYRDISSRIMHVLKEEVQNIEVYSIDEAFFNVHTNVTEKEMAEMRMRVMQKTGIPVSIGVAHTKTRAKIANNIAKHRMRDGRLTMSAIGGGEGGEQEQEEGVCILDMTMWENIKNTLPCGNVWGIGRQTTAFLTSEKIETVGQLLACDRAFIKQSLGVVGERLCMELSGTSIYRVGDSVHTQESYTSTRSFGKIIRDKETLISALSYHITHLAEKLRTQSEVASKISIVLQGSRYGAFSHREDILSTTLTMSTNDTTTLIREAQKLLIKLYDSEIPYKKAGIILSGILREEVTSRSLFDDHNTHEDRSVLNTVTDNINKKFGAHTLHFGVLYGTEKWKENKRLVSKEYTTKWSEICTVKAI